MDPRLLVTITDLAPGAPLDVAVGLADALDARRVPLTLLLGPCPHPEVAAWVRARRRIGDAILLHGRQDRPGAERGTPFRRLAAHEAGLRLAGALRQAESTGLTVDGFAVPGWAGSTGVRLALGAAGTDLLLDDRGLHRLDVDGAAVATCPGAPIAADAPSARRPRRRGREPQLRHLTVGLGDGRGRALPRAVDEALAAGALPVAATHALPASPARRPFRSRGDDPELWSITA